MLVSSPLPPIPAFFQFSLVLAQIHMLPRSSRAQQHVSARAPLCVRGEGTRVQRCLRCGHPCTQPCVNASSKKHASPHLTAGTAEELACLINSPLIWNLLTEQKLLHKSSRNLHSSSLSLITTDLTSSAGADQPPTVLPARRLSITTTY